MKGCFFGVWCWNLKSLAQTAKKETYMRIMGNKGKQTCKDELEFIRTNWNLDQALTSFTPPTLMVEEICRRSWHLQSQSLTYSCTWPRSWRRYRRSFYKSQNNMASPFLSSKSITNVSLWPNLTCNYLRKKNYGNKAPAQLS